MQPGTAMAIPGWALRWDFCGRPDGAHRRPTWRGMIFFRKVVATFRDHAWIMLGSGACEWDGDEPRRVIRLQPHQHRALAIGVGVRNGVTHIRRGGDFLAADVEDDVAGL